MTKYTCSNAPTKLKKRIIANIPLYSKVYKCYCGREYTRLDFYLHFSSRFHLKCGKTRIVFID